MTAYQAENPENQPLIDALMELAEVETRSVISKASFRGRSLKTAAKNLAQLQEKVTDGQELFEGPKKVKGVGRGTAYYIDEFLKTGRLSEIDEIKANTKEQDVKTGIEGPSYYTDDGYSPGSEDEEGSRQTMLDKKNLENAGIIHIESTPVLILWVTVVAERLGYSSEEALTYGRWISSVLEQSKGEAMGVLQKRRDKTSEPKTKRRKKENTDNRHVEVFVNIDIPVKKKNGMLLAVEKGQGEPIDHKRVQEYLIACLGEKDLETAKDAMKKLAETVPREELKDKAYEIYEMVRPEWHAWNKKSTLDLNKVHDLEKLRKETKQEVS